MTWFKIISLEEFESYLGKIKKGDEINRIETNNLQEAKQWAYEQYGPYGENIKFKIKEIKIGD